MNIVVWGVSPELLGQIIAYFFGCISGAMGGALWRRLRRVEARVTTLEEHEQEGTSHDDDSGP